MICAKCGKPLKEGSLYCDACGAPVQMVPDYNEFDDYLDHLVGEEESSDTKPVRPNKKANDMQNTESVKHQPDHNNHNGNNNNSRKKQQQKIIMISAAVCVIAIVILVAAVTGNVKKSHDNSFDYQIEQAKKAYDSGNMTEAVSYYEKALSIDPDNVDARYELADIYMKQKDTDAAAILYQEIISLDPKSEEAYKELISIYESKKNYDAIVSLRDDTKDGKILKLFDSYTVSKPQFSENSGKFGESIDLTIKADSGSKIYYSFDSEDPVKDGKLYSRPIALDQERTYEINAVAVDDRGISSDVATAKYEIEFDAPDMPDVDPDGGTFGAPADISITAPANCRVYYTWDSTDPSAASTEYTAPIPIPEGNNVLSVIAIDQNTGKCSEIYRSRYEFYLNDQQ
ncbi:tetratricopeptide repeat protein [Agathobacter sp.]